MHLAQDLNLLKQIQKFAFGKYIIFEYSVCKEIKFDMEHSVTKSINKAGGKINIWAWIMIKKENPIKDNNQ